MLCKNTQTTYSDSKTVIFSSVTLIMTPFINFFWYNFFSILLYVHICNILLILNLMLLLLCFRITDSSGYCYWAPSYFWYKMSSPNYLIRTRNKNRWILCLLSNSLTFQYQFHVIYICKVNNNKNNNNLKIVGKANRNLLLAKSDYKIK